MYGFIIEINLLTLLEEIRIIYPDFCFIREVCKLNLPNKKYENFKLSS